MECKTIAIFRYTWPGKDETYCCVSHGARIAHVAQVLGFHLQMILIDPSINKKCSSMDGEQ